MADTWADRRARFHQKLDSRRRSGPLEKLARKIPADFGQTDPETHYWVFGPILALQIGWVIHLGRIGIVHALGLMLSGILAWTLLEYLLHRFSFHSRSEHPLLRPFNSGLHLLHHRAPADRLYVAAPIAMALPVYLIALALFRLASGNLERTLMVGSGMVLSFLFYEYTHYFAHQKNPRNPIMKRLKKHHMLHHFGDEEHLFGVTSPLWDYVFRTHRFQPAARRGAGARPGATGQSAAG